MSKTIRTSIVLLLALFSSSQLLAGAPPPPPPPPFGIPVDTGAAILLVAGVVLAVRKVYMDKKNQSAAITE